MQRVIVTVKRQGEAQVRDLEVPADVQAGRLAQLVADALHWSSDAAGQRLSYRIEAQPLGRQLQPEESLEAAGVWDGAWLVFAPEQGALPRGPVTPPVSTPPPQPPRPGNAGNTPPAAGLVGGWRKLVLPGGTDATPGAAPGPAAPDEAAHDGGFVWKRLD